MNTHGWSARILFLLFLGLVGTLAYEWWMGFLGIGIGLIAISIQAVFSRLPAEDIVYLLIGASAGLVFGIVLMFALRLGNIHLGKNDGGSDPLIMIPFAMSYIFAHVAVIKGRKLGLLQLHEYRGEKKVIPTLADFSAIVDGRVADMVITGILNGPFVVPSSVRNELDSLAQSREIIARGRARRGFETLERLEEATTEQGGINYVDFGSGDRIRGKILDWLSRESAIFISANEDILDAADREGSKVIRLDEVGPATRTIILPGEKLKFRVVKRGRNPGQGIGFLSDGTMIVIEDAADSIGEIVTAVAHTTFRASGGTMVFGRKIQPDESNGQGNQQVEYTTERRDVSSQ